MIDMALKADKTFVFGEECYAYKKSEAIKAQAEAEAKVPEWKKNEIPQEERLFPEDERERKRRYNREALKALVPIVKDEETAKAIITAIAKEAVPHIHIDYT